MKLSLDELLLSGPGHDGYAYNADTYCVACGQDIITDLYDDGQYKDEDSGDTNIHPQPIFFGESPDYEQSCSECGIYLYGEDSEEETEEN